MSPTHNAGDFRAGTRRVHGSVKNLSLHRGLCPGPLSLTGLRGSPSEVTEWITGLVATKDRVVVIDSDIGPTNEFLFTLRPYDDVEGLAAA